MSIDVSSLWHYDLRKGKTEHPRNGACLFDAGMWLVYGKIGDNPPCSCPIIRSYGIRLNDSMNNKQRQLLKPFILRIVGNRDPEAEAKRLHFIILETARQVLPLILYQILPFHAIELRNLPNNASYTQIQRAAAAVAAADAATHATDAAAIAVARAAAAHAAHAAVAAAAAADAATHATDAATHATARAAIAVWNKTIEILDGALRIGKQSPEYDPSELIQAVNRFELARTS